MMLGETATLELACGRCHQWWLRWTVDLDIPFDDQRVTLFVPASGVVIDESPGSWVLATDGTWKRWTPRRDQPWAEGEMYGRQIFVCPNGCPTAVQAREDKLHDAAVAALRYLHDTRTPLFTTTVDKLLNSAP